MPTAFPKPTTSLAARYSAALIAIAIDLVAALGQLTGPITLVSGLQLLALAASSFGIYYLPLLDGRYAAAAKVGIAALLAGIAAAIPFLATGTITGPQIALVVLAILKALGTPLGVAARRDAHALAA